MRPFPITPATVDWSAVARYREHPESIFRAYPSDEEIVALAWIDHPHASLSELFYVAECIFVPPPPVAWFAHPAANQRDSAAREADHASLGCLLAASLAGFPDRPSPAAFAELLRSREPTDHERQAMYQFFSAIELPDLYFLQSSEALTLRELVAALHCARVHRRAFSRSLASLPAARHGSLPPPGRLARQQPSVGSRLRKCRVRPLSNLVPERCTRPNGSRLRSRAENPTARM